MRIGVNTLFLIPGEVGGTETYTRELLRAMTRLYPGDEFILFCNRENAGTFEPAPNMREVLCGVRAARRPSRILYEQWGLPRQARKERLDVLLSAGNSGPFRVGCPHVVTIHETQHRRFPENYKLHYLLATRFIVRRSCASAARVIAVSNTLAREVVQLEHVPAERVSAVSHGVREEFFVAQDAAETEAALARLGVRRPYALAVANSYPHKNLPRLVRAYARIAERIAQDLVIVGPARNAENAVLTECRRLRLNERVRRVPAVSLDPLRALYQGAGLFVLPSLYEGFGLPVIEAMASGTPVACSRIPVFEEVAGDAAEFFDPENEQNMASVIARLLADEPRRRDLARRGRERARTFTWERAARETRAVLERALEETAPRGVS